MTRESGLDASARLLLENYAAVLNAQQTAWEWLELFWEDVHRRLADLPSTLGGLEVFLVKSLTDKRSSKEDEGAKAMYGLQIKFGRDPNELFSLLVEDARRWKWSKRPGDELRFSVDSTAAAVKLAGTKKIDLQAAMRGFTSEVEREHIVVKTSARPYWRERYTFKHFDERDAIAVADRVRNIIDREIGDLIRQLS